MSRFLYIVGARPQFIKMAAVNRAARDRVDHEQLIVHTGQHFDDNMSDAFFRELEIPQPGHNLAISNLSHGAMTGRMLEGIEAVIVKEKPDWVVVFGDTNSTLAGALAAVKQGVLCAHVEAGLRSFNRAMPEEINRVLADQCADLLLTPTSTATDHLHREGIPGERIRQVGDVMHDVACYYRDKVRQHGSLEKYGLARGEYALVTVHRAENTDNPVRLRAIVDGLLAIAKEMPVVFPVHPRTRAAFDKHGLLAKLDELTLLDPIGYQEMVLLESNAKVIVTDSGGVQKEAYFFQVPCLVLRDETEWVELVDKGFHSLVKVGQDDLPALIRTACAGTYDWSEQLYGKGDAAANIVEALLSYG